MKLFNNLNQENNIINAIKEQFLDWTNKNDYPGWTDRILYKKSNNIKCIKYDRINIKISDHRPVFGLFEINV